MGSSHDAVMEYMEDELKKDPGAKNKTLFAGAREIDESVGELTLQQFHAKYRLPATRRIAPPPQPARLRRGRGARRRARDHPGRSVGHGGSWRGTLEADPASNADLFAGAREIRPPPRGPLGRSSCESTPSK